MSLLKCYSVQSEFPLNLCICRNLFHRENHTLIDVLQEDPNIKRILIFIDSGLDKRFPKLQKRIERFFSIHPDTFILAGIHVIQGGEEAKQDLVAWQHTLSCIAEAKIDRHSYIMAIGGGAFLDVVGFAAATAHRGIRLIRVPTTTLSQADSGVGIKNGINFMGQKNYLGTFAIPSLVILDFLFTHYQTNENKLAGLVEAVKVALIKDAEFFEWFEENIYELRDYDRDLVEEAIMRSAEAHVLHITEGGDPYELGSSRPLDFGHWSAHYLETISNYTISHAEAVAIGICLDNRYAVRKGWITAEEEERILRIFRFLRFPTYHPLLSTKDENGDYEILKGLKKFQEHLGGELTILMLTGIGSSRNLRRIDTEVFATCIEDCKARSESSSVPE